MTRLTITTTNTPTGPVIGISGDLDHTTAEQLRTTVAALPLHQGQHLILDLSDLAFCDSSGLTALLTAHNHAQAAQAALTLSAVPDRTLRTIRLIGLDQVFTLHP
ncbi:MAG: STAS domain-containing protein [Saccharothrix sp.]|nr:STAS domain-containing protein [Saccharothrix sp.]